MQEFVELFISLDQTTKTNQKIDAIVSFLQEAKDEDKMAMLALFCGRRPKRYINTTQLKTWAAEYAQLPYWLFDECHTIVGDLSETIALLVPENDSKNTVKKSLFEWVQYIKNYKNLTEHEKKEAVYFAWRQLSKNEKFIFNKLTSGAFRVGVSQTLLAKAIAKFSGKTQDEISFALTGNWDENSTTFEELILKKDPNADASKPYPFCLAYALDIAFDELGKSTEWIAEYKWDGIRCQVIKRYDTLFIWSRGEELITDNFPDLLPLQEILPNGTVLDGELVGYKNKSVLPFNILQQRISRKNITSKIKDTCPVAIIAYDILEYDKQDIREKPLRLRREVLEKLLNDNKDLNGYLILSGSLEFYDWTQLQEIREKSREVLAEGLMIKNKCSVYHTGRKRGDWWKWKVNPMTADCVLLYAQRGSGRRANLYTDYTFALWEGDKLVTFAKAYSGLTDKEIAELDKWIRQNTLDRFGPVCTVKPELVFEIGFEGISESKRHKSGLAVRFPRILRQRFDKTIKEADTVENVRKLMVI